MVVGRGLKLLSEKSFKPGNKISMFLFSLSSIASWSSSLPASLIVGEAFSFVGGFMLILPLAAYYSDSRNLDCISNTFSSGLRIVSVWLFCAPLSSSFLCLAVFSELSAITLRTFVGVLSPPDSSPVSLLLLLFPFDYFFLFASIWLLLWSWFIFSDFKDSWEDIFL